MTDPFKLQIAKGKLEHYIKYDWPKRAGQISVRFVNGNFRAQGWQGQGFSKWPANKRKGTILVKKGRLRRATSFTADVAKVIIYNNTPYAAIHNNGFKGTVQVKQHTRRRFTKTRVEAGGLTKTGKLKMKTISNQTGQGIVKAHSRKMNIPKRQFMPNNTTDSPVLQKAILREIERSLQQIFPNR